MVILKIFLVIFILWWFFIVPFSVLMACSDVIQDWIRAKAEELRERARAIKKKVDYMEFVRERGK